MRLRSGGGGEGEENTDTLSRRARDLINREFRNIILENAKKQTKELQSLTPQPQSASETVAIKTARKNIRDEWEKLKNATLISNDSPEKNPSDVLRGVVAYIEINNVPKATALTVILQNLGATVKDKFTAEVTHVIFKRGSFETFKRAKLWNSWLVSVLWIEACNNAKTKIPEELFPIADYSDYASPRTFRKFMEMSSNERKNLITRSTRQIKQPQQKKGTTDDVSSESNLVLQISSDDSIKKNDKHTKDNRLKANEENSESVLPQSLAYKKRLFASERDECIDQDNKKNKRLDAKTKRRLFNQNNLDSSSAIDNLSDSSRASTPVVNPSEINPYRIQQKLNEKAIQKRNRAKTKTQPQKERDENSESENCEENSTDDERRKRVREILKVTKQQNIENKNQEKQKRKRLVKVKEVKRKKLTQEEKDEVRKANRIARREQKEILRAMQPRSCRKINIYKDGILTPSLVSTSLHSAENKQLEQHIRSLGTFTFKACVESDTTHLVVGEVRRTINLLKAIARGCWIVDHRWVEESVKMGHWVAEYDYEVTSFSPAVQKCRLERNALGPDYRMDIFLDHALYISAHCTPHRKELRSLVLLCRGRVVSEAKDASVVVGERADRKTCVSELWVLDSVQAGRCKSLKKYLMI